MSVTIWHNPKCSTSRKVLDAIRAHGVEPHIVLYLETPPSEREIRTVL
jgi:arsenate reductase